MKKVLFLSIIAVILIGGVYASRNMSITTNSVDSVTPTPTSTIPKSGTVTLKLGETAAFEGFLIRPVLVAEDSRCPAGVYCIQAGRLRVRFDIDTDTGSTSHVLSLGESTTTAKEKITFISSDPLKTASKPIDSVDYRFTISVESL